MCEMDLSRVETAWSIKPLVIPGRETRTGLDLSAELFLSALWYPCPQEKRQPLQNHFHCYRQKC